MYAAGTIAAASISVSARIGAMIVGAAAARGVAADGLMAAAGFEAAWLDDPDARMPLAVETRLWDEAARRSGDVAFGLHAAAAIRPGMFQVLDAAVLRRPVPAADAELSRIVTAHADGLLERLGSPAASWSDRVRRALLQGLDGERATLPAVARQLGLSERSLQRRLRDEGTGFAPLLDAVRHELALRWVGEGRLALGEVAYLLGFSEPSAFHRAFRRWTGTTPQAMRRGAAQPATNTDGPASTDPR